MDCGLVRDIRCLELEPPPRIYLAVASAVDRQAATHQPASAMDKG